MACCQSDIAWPQIEKISATVKDVNKKLSKVIPRRPTLQLHRTYYTVISGCHLRSLITAEMEHVVSLGCQRTDCTLGCIVVYRITTILYICKDVCPKCIQIVQRFLQIRSNSRRILGLLYTEMSAEIYQDAFRLKTLTLFPPLLVSKIILVYWRSKLYKSSIYLMKISAFLSLACSLAFTNLARACARHT